MKQSIYYILSLITLLSFTEAGLITGRSTCYNHDGEEIPCKIFVSKKEDYGFVDAPKKRDLGLLNGLFGGRSKNRESEKPIQIEIIDDGSYWNNRNRDRNSWNTGNTSTGRNAGSSLGGNSGNSFGRNTGNASTGRNTGNSLGGNSGNSFGRNTGNVSTGRNTGSSLGGNSGSSFGRNTGNASTGRNTGNSLGGNSGNSFGRNGGNASASNSGNFDRGLDNEGVSRNRAGGIGYGAPQNENQIKPSTYNGSVKLPMNDLTMTRFNGCSSHQAAILKKLINDITIYRAAADYTLSHMNEDSMFEQIYLKYFKDQRYLSYVQRTFSSVNSMRSIDAYCETSSNRVCNDRAIAYTYANSREFHVCPIFFTYPYYGTINNRQSEAAAIVLHEMTHCYGTDDHAYGEANSKALPSSKASNNADTYRLFAMKSIYYLNERGTSSFKKMMLSEDEKIDFRSTPLTDRVLPAKDKQNNSQETTRIPNVIYKRDVDNFLDENIDFRDIPLKNKFIDRSERQ